MTLPRGILFDQFQLTPEQMARPYLEYWQVVVCGAGNLATLGYDFKAAMDIFEKHAAQLGRISPVAWVGESLKHEKRIYLAEQSYGVRIYPPRSLP